MAMGEMLPITNDTAKRGTRAARIKREAQKEVERGHSQYVSKHFNDTLDEYREAGISFGDNNPSPETVLRVLSIVKQIQKGETQVDTWKWIQDEYGVGIKTAQALYQSALRFLVPTDVMEARENAIAILQTRYEQLYKRAYDEGQLKTARDILDSLAKLQGLAGQGNTIKYAENANGEKMVVVTFD